MGLGEMRKQDTARSSGQAVGPQLGGRAGQEARESKQRGAREILFCFVEFLMGEVSTALSRDGTFQRWQKARLEERVQGCKKAAGIAPVRAG